MPDPRFRFLRQAIYALKRRYAQEITLYYPLTNDDDIVNGPMSATYQTAIINKAVVLTDTAERKFSYDLAFIASNRNVTYGGLYDHRFRRVLIDRKDLPSDFHVDMKCFLRFDNFRWEVRKFFEFENKEAIIFEVIRVEGATAAPNDISLSVETQTQVEDENVQS